jgi:hypothetical protein
MPTPEELESLFLSSAVEEPAEGAMSAAEAEKMFDTSGSSPIEDPVQTQPRVVWNETLSKALEVPGWYHGGQIGSAMRQNFEPIQEDVTEIGRSFLRGALKMPEAVGEAVRFVGDHIGSETLPGGQKPEMVKSWETNVQKFLLDQGDLIVDTWKNLQKSAKINGVELTQANPEIWQGKFMENPSYTRGIATVVQAIPSLAAGYVITAATKNPWAGASVLGLVDGMSARGEAREAGKSVKTQDMTAGAVAIVNTLLEKIPLEKFFGGGKGKIAGTIEGAVTEGGTEALQTMWENTVAKIGYDESRELMAGVVESLLVGAVTGGTLGGMSSNTTKSIDRAFNKLRLAGMSEEAINELTYNAAVELAKNANTPLLTTTLEDGTSITLSVNEAIGARLQEVSKQSQPTESIDIKGPVLSPEEMVTEAGGNFLGVTEGFKLKDGTEKPGLVSFRSPTTGSTIAIKTTELTPELIKKKIEESDAAFANAEKATPAEAAKREESPDIAQVEQAIQEAPDDSEVLQSGLPKIFKDLQTVTAKTNEYRARNQPVPEPLLIRQRQMIHIVQSLMNTEQAQTNPRIKSIIREMTGQVESSPKMVTEMNALKGSLQMAVRTARDTERLTERSLNDFKKGLVEEIKLRLPPSKERGQFLSTVAGIKYGADLSAVAERVERVAENYKRKELTKEIKNQLKKIQKSNVIAVDYVAKIEELMDQFEMGMTPETRKNLEKTQAYIDKERAKGNDVAMSQRVLDQLQGLYREDLKAVDSNALQNLLDEIIFLRDLGRNKLRMREAITEAQVSQALIELAAGSKPANNLPRYGSPLERNSMGTNVKNIANDVADWIVNHQRGFSFVDTVFDKFDGNAGYTGPNYRHFKVRASTSFRAYLNHRDPIRKRIGDLAKKLDLDVVDMKNIGFHAVKVQEGGVDKLLKMGFTQKQIDEHTLTAPQIEMYQAFRGELDVLWPRVKDVLRRVYNADPESVENYFPFHTDFDALNSRPIEERFNRNAPDLVDTMIKNQQGTTAFNKNTPSKNFSLERTGGKQPIRLNAMEVFLNHVDNAAYLVNMGETLQFMSTLARNEGYRTIAGDQAQQFVADWIDVLSRNGNRTDKIWATDALRKNTSAAMLGFRLSSILVQGTALMDGAAEIGAYAFEGAERIATSKEWRTFVQENMPEVRNRVGDDPHFAEFGGTTPLDKFNKKGFWALQKFDSLTAASVAAGAYMKYIRENNLPFDRNNPQAGVNADALNYAQDVVARTQSSAYAKDLPLALNKANLFGKDVLSNTSINRLLLQFQTFMLKRWDTLTHQGIDLGFAKGNAAKGVNVLSFLIMAKMAEYGTRGVLAALVQGLTGAEPEDKDEENLFGSAVLNILGDIPFVSSIMSVGQYGSVPVPAIQMLSRAAERSAGFFSAKQDATKARNLTRASLLWLGILGGVGGASQVEDIYAKSTAKKGRILE